MTQTESIKLAEYLKNFSKETLLDQKSIEKLFLLKEKSNGLFEKNKNEIQVKLIKLQSQLPKNYYVGGNGLICNSDQLVSTNFINEKKSFKNWYDKLTETTSKDFDLENFGEDLLQQVKNQFQH